MKEFIKSIWFLVKEMFYFLINLPSYGAGFLKSIRIIAKEHAGVTKALESSYKTLNLNYHDSTSITHAINEVIRMEEEHAKSLNKFLNPWVSIFALIVSVIALLLSK